MDMQCQMCGKVSAAGTEQCECGWDFTTGRFGGAEKSVENRISKQRESIIHSRAMASWNLPVIAWVSQLIYATMLTPSKLGAVFPLLLAIAQLILFFAGLWCGLKVLTLGKAKVASGDWVQAIVGIVLCAGTLILIAGFFIFRPA